MSEYVDIKTEFKSLDALLDALQECGGWTREQIETHAEPQHLIGYHGDTREQTAHVIIRRKNVGTAANDIGFYQEPGTGKYRAVISQFDHGKYGAGWQGRLSQSYAYHAIRRQQARMGRTVTRETLKNGKMIVTVGGIR